MRSASTAHLVPDAHPAHALLSVAHALLTPASAIASSDTRTELADLSVLPIDEVALPTSDVTDFRDVVDAINRLCDTMKTSYDYDDPSVAESWVSSELVAPEEVTVRTVEIHRAEIWSEVPVSPPECVEGSVTSDDQPTAQCEPVSDMYYTASSEVSLLSDSDLPERCQDDSLGKEEKKECVIAGHVAAMRERFESMTRSNTPCPDLLRSSSPSLDVFRVTPSPDSLG